MDRKKYLQKAICATRFYICLSKGQIALWKYCFPLTIDGIWAISSRLKLLYEMANIKNPYQIISEDVRVELLDFC